MRLLVVSQHFWPSVGGAEIMVRRLAGEWARARDEVVVLTTQAHASAVIEEEFEGYRVVRLPVSTRRWWGTVRYLRDLAYWLRGTRSRFDLIYVSMLKHPAYACVGASRSGDVPVVLRAEGAGRTGDMAWQVHALMGSWIRHRTRMADAFVAPSAQIRQEMIEAGFSSQKIESIPNGVPVPATAWFAEATSAARESQAIPDAPTIAYVGRLHRDKGLGDLLAAFVEVRKAVGAINLLLVGDGPDRANLELRARDLGVVESIRFEGNVDDVESRLRGADLFVLPSYQEGQSVALLEAIALGLPAIASDIPANRDLVPAELLPRFPTRDPRALAAAIVDDLHDSARRMDRCALARKYVAERFGIEAVADRHRELFARLVAGRTT